jgi:ribosomal protein S18 acetylase RimI-like enzyme
LANSTSVRGIEYDVLGVSREATMLLARRRDARIIQDQADPDVETALEVNRCAALADMASGPGGEVHDEPGLFWCLSGLPWDAFNVVGHCALSEAEIDERIVEKQSYYGSHGRPLVWWATEYTRPPDLVDRLLAHGFVHRLTAPGMVSDLRELPASILVPEGTTIERVTDVPTLDAWVQTCLTGFGVSDANHGPALTLFTQLALVEDTEWHCYLASLHGQPAASAGVLMTGGVAGIYWVGTVPEARRLSLGAAVTAAALHSARDRGYRLGTLTSSKLGYSMYQRLGFSDYATFHNYVWKAST